MTYPSDRRWKQNIISIDGALDKLQNLRGIFFEWKRDEYPDKGFQEGTQVGFIAQEVEAVFPEVVKTDQDGYMSVDYAKMTTLLVEAIKAQQKEIEALKAGVAALQGKSNVALQELVQE